MKIKKGSYGISALAVIVASVAFTNAANAQVAAGSSGIEVSGDIIVTATKRSELLSKTPISITALTKEALDTQGIRSISDVARTTPGLTFQTTNAFGDTNVSLRGIFSTVGAATTGIYIDDTAVQVRQGNDTGLQPIYANIFDLDRVEVLRGPQGTLYGAGSEGGTIRYILAKPSLTEMSSYARAEIATTKGGAPTYELGAAVGGPLIRDKLGFRASAWFRREGGWIDRIASTVVSDGHTIEKNANSQKLGAARLALIAQPTEAVTISPSFMYQSNAAHDVSLHWDLDGNNKQEGGIRQPSSSKYMIASNNIDVDLGGVTVTSVTSYLNGLGKHHIDETYFDTATISNIFGIKDPVRGGNAIIYPQLPDFTADYYTRTRLKQWSQELRIASSDRNAPISWIAGAYYQDSRANSRQREYEPLFDNLFQLLTGDTAGAFFGAPVLPGGITYLQDNGVKEGQFALFGDVTVKLTSRLKLELGARYAWTRYNFVRYQDGPWNGGPFASSGRQRERPFTPKIGLNYDLNGGLLYATAAKGYRIGGANSSLAGNVGCHDEIVSTFGQNDIPLTYASDSVWSYEVGGKGRALDKRINFAASAFWVDWKNIQGNVTLKCLFNFTTNLGQAVSRGFDLSFSGKVTDELSLGADLGYVDAHYTTNYLFSGALLAKKGDKLPTPDFTAHIFADYRRPMGTGAYGYGRIDYNYNAPYDQNPSADVVGVDATLANASRFSELSVRVGYQFNGFDISLFANNLLNDQARQFQSRWAGSAYYLSVSPRPRTIGLTFTMNK